ncbi:MAG: type II toxin-antitoxin system VapC family toxin [Candidatus Sumerlaeota bacterium]|nr:type II toxin-antitoxin system VapC family toxin [Candidatus Sumerlaeota bacterium]
MLTLDASVFVASCHRREAEFGASRALLSALSEADVPLIEPALLPVEVAAALRRADNDPRLAREFAAALLSLPQLTLLPVDERLAQRALDIAIAHSLRGADALYAAVAVQYGARLVTIDGEQLQRSPEAVGACRPEAARKLLKA